MILGNFSMFYFFDLGPQKKVLFFFDIIFFIDNFKKLPVNDRKNAFWSVKFLIKLLFCITFLLPLKNKKEMYLIAQFSLQ